MKSVYPYSLEFVARWIASSVRLYSSGGFLHVVLTFVSETE